MFIFIPLIYGIYYFFEICPNDSYPINSLFLPLTLVVIPVVEEMIFRLPLVKSKSNAFISIICTIIYMALSEDYLIISLLLTHFVFLIFFFLNTINLKKMLLIGSMIFSLMHLEFFVEDLGWMVIILFPILVGSHFTGGLILSLLRRHGLMYSILFHSSSNLIIISLILLFSS